MFRLSSAMEVFALVLHTDNNNLLRFQTVKQFLDVANQFLAILLKRTYWGPIVLPFGLSASPTLIMSTMAHTCRV